MMSLETKSFTYTFTVLELTRFSHSLLVAQYKFKCPETKELWTISNLKYFAFSLNTCYLNILIHSILKLNASQPVPMSLNLIISTFSCLYPTLKPIYCCSLFCICIILWWRGMCLNVFYGLHKITFYLQGDFKDTLQNIRYF